MKSEASIRSYVSPFGDITRKVVKLILTRPIDPKMVGKLERFCKNVEAFSRRMPASNHQVGMSRYVIALRAVCGRRWLICLVSLCLTERQKSWLINWRQ